MSGIRTEWHIIGNVFYSTFTNIFYFYIFIFIREISSTTKRKEKVISTQNQTNI